MWVGIRRQDQDFGGWLEVNSKQQAASSVSGTALGRQLAENGCLATAPLQVPQHRRRIRIIVANLQHAISRRDGDLSPRDANRLIGGSAAKNLRRLIPLSRTAHRLHRLLRQIWRYFGLAVVGQVELAAPVEPFTVARKTELAVLPATFEHALQLGELPWPNRDELPQDPLVRLAAGPEILERVPAFLQAQVIDRNRSAHVSS